MLTPSRLRTGWAVASVLAVLVGAAYTAAHLDFTSFTSELRFRGEAHHDLVKVLDNLAVKAGLKCGPLTTPNHKLVRDSLWGAGLPADHVEPQARAGLALGGRSARGPRHRAGSREHGPRPRTSGRQPLHNPQAG